MDVSIQIVQTQPFSDQSPVRRDCARKLPLFSGSPITWKTLFKPFSIPWSRLMARSWWSAAMAGILTGRRCRSFSKWRSRPGLRKLSSASMEFLYPAASCVIRKYRTSAYYSLSLACPGGPRRGFWRQVQRVERRTRTGGIDRSDLCRLSNAGVTVSLEMDVVDIDVCGETLRGSTRIRVIDSVQDYLDLMRNCLISRKFPLLRQTDFSFLL